MEIQITSRNEAISTLELKESLEHLLNQKNVGIPLTIKTPELTEKGVDPNVIYALVEVVSSALLSALITELLQILKSKSVKRMVIVSKSRARIEVPADIDISANLDVVIEKIKELDQENIRVVAE